MQGLDKAGGLDGILQITVRDAVKAALDYFLETLNGEVRGGIFPKTAAGHPWKSSGVVHQI